MREEIIAYGHPNITARHRSTMQVTKDEEIGPRADCIIGVRANKSVRDLSPELRSHLLEGGSIHIMLIVGDYTFSFEAEGSSRLVLNHERDAVIRRSTYIDGRTLAVRSTAAARDIPRDMIRALRRGDEIMMEILF